MRFFTSDPHFFHQNILAYAKRPFKSVDEMNEVLISNHNSVVSASDTVYYTGDVIMGDRKAGISVLSKLNGTKILVLGNHDYPFEHRNKDWWHQFYLDNGFSEIHPVLNMMADPMFESVGSPMLRLHHFPVVEAFVQDHNDDIRYKNLRKSQLPGILHLSGHTHLKDHVAAERNIHVGVDATRWNFAPVSELQLLEVCIEQGWRFDGD